MTDTSLVERLERYAGRLDQMFDKEFGAVFREAATALREMDNRVAELEAGLKEAELQLQYLHGKFKPTGSGECVLARINALLSKEPK